MSLTFFIGKILTGELSHGTMIPTLTRDSRNRYCAFNSLRFQRVLMFAWSEMRPGCNDEGRDTSTSYLLVAPNVCGISLNSDSCFVSLCCEIRCTPPFALHVAEKIVLCMLHDVRLRCWLPACCIFVSRVQTTAFVHQ